MSQATKRKTEITTTEESPSFKRKRMLEIRAIVAHAVKHNQRVDLMEFEGTDIPRVIIALQDALTDSQQRHKRASNHIAEQKGNMESIGGMFTLIMDAATDNLLHDQMRIGEVSTMLRAERESHMQTAQMLDQTFADNNRLHEENQGLKLALRSSLNEGYPD